MGFLSIQQLVTRHQAEISAIKAQLNRISTRDGQLRFDGSTFVGLLPTHDHTGAGEGGIIGYSERKVCDTLLTLSATAQDVAGCSVTLPTPGTYLIYGIFVFFVNTVGATGDDMQGFLSDSANNLETEFAGWGEVPTAGAQSLHLVQQWRITTTANNEVWKLRALRSGTTGTFQVLVTHTTILAFGMPGTAGGDGGHASVTLSGTPDYITLSGQDIMRGLVDLAADVSGLLPEANIHAAIARDNELHTQLHGSLDHNAAPTPTQIDIGDGAVTGTSEPGRGDHQHAHPAPGAGYPLDVAAAEADGAAATPARSDHGHAHGSGYLTDAHHTESHAAAHADGGGDELAVQDLASDVATDGQVAAADGAGATIFEDIYTTHIITFSSENDTPAAGDTVDGFPQGINVGESGEHGAFTAIRSKCTVDDANKGTGTNTIAIEADDNPAFSSLTRLFILNIDALGEVDDIMLDNTWAAGDIFVRARWIAVATAPKRVRVQFFFKEQAENF